MSSYADVSMDVGYGNGLSSNEWDAALAIHKSQEERLLSLKAKAILENDQFALKMDEIKAAMRNTVNRLQSSEKELQDCRQKIHNQAKTIDEQTALIKTLTAQVQKHKNINAAMQKMFAEGDMDSDWSTGFNNPSVHQQQPHQPQPQNSPAFGLPAFGSVNSSYDGNPFMSASQQPYSVSSQPVLNENTAPNASISAAKSSAIDSKTFLALLRSKVPPETSTKVFGLVRLCRNLERDDILGRARSLLSDCNCAEEIMSEFAALYDAERSL